MGLLATPIVQVEMALLMESMQVESEEEVQQPLEAALLELVETLLV